MRLIDADALHDWLTSYAQHGIDDHLRANATQLMKHVDEQPTVLDTTLAELAALKARRCETCEYGEAVAGAYGPKNTYCELHWTWLKERITALGAELQQAQFAAEQNEVAYMQALAHATDCERLVTACQNDLGEERIKSRGAEAEVAALTDEIGRWRRGLLVNTCSEEGVLTTAEMKRRLASDGGRP